MGRSRAVPVAWALTVVTAGLLAACTQPADHIPPPESDLGDPVRGRQAIADYGCGSCHLVPGVTQADGLVGPPLTRFGARSYVAGALPNTAENLRRWIMDPQGVEPGTAMPDLGVTAVDARDIAAYLLTLE